MNKSVWNSWGEFFGFPPCCVAAFPHECSESSVFTGTGFRPCKECNKKDPRVVLKYIDTHRKCEYPFPYCSNPEEVSKQTLIRFKFVNNLRMSEVEING